MYSLYFIVYMFYIASDNTICYASNESTTQCMSKFQENVKHQFRDGCGFTDSSKNHNIDRAGKCMYSWFREVSIYGGYGGLPNVNLIRSKGTIVSQLVYIE